MPTIDPAELRLITFATPEFQEVSERWEEFHRHRFPSAGVTRIPGKGNWRANCGLKPSAILEGMRGIPDGRVVIYTDADAAVRAVSVPDDLDFDVGIVRNPNPEHLNRWAAAAIVFKAGEGAWNFLAAWEALCKFYGNVDHPQLTRVISNPPQGVRVVNATGWLEWSQNGLNGASGEKPPIAGDSTAFDPLDYGIPPEKRVPPWGMDIRHTAALRDLVDQIKPSVVVEVGCHEGRSTTAFLSALDAGHRFELHLVEIKPTELLKQAMKRCSRPDLVHLHVEPVWEADPLSADLVLIDGDHRWPALADTLWALSRDVPVIAMHDTRSHSHGIDGCWGAQTAADILRRAHGRKWWADEETREGEWTHRGLGVSWKESLRLYPSALR